MNKFKREREETKHQKNRGVKTKLRDNLVIFLIARQFEIMRVALATNERVHCARPHCSLEFWPRTLLATDLNWSI